jgi:hypothetical protein
MPELWPADVPYAPRANSLRVLNPFQQPLATDMDDGQQRRRRSSTLQLAGLQFVIKMENDEFDLFKLWVRDDVVDGTLSFDVPVWTGSDYETKTCTFRQPYSDDPGRGIRHLVTVVLDVEDY